MAAATRTPFTTFRFWISTSACTSVRRWVSVGVAEALASHGVMAGAGDFYAMRTIGAMGCDKDAGVLRLSFVHYTSDAEVEKLMTALDATL